MDGPMDPERLLRKANVASRILKAMGNERRFAILCHLAQGEKSVGELQRLVGLSQSALSQHLARLRRVKIVKTRRAAQTIYYSLDGPAAPMVMTALTELYADPRASADELHNAPRTVRL